MVFMMLWPQGSGWMRVYRWLRSVARRAQAQAKRNEDLNDAQRRRLSEEAAAIEARAADVRLRGRALEDFEDETLGAARDEAVVTDALCDGAQTEVWNVLGARRAVLAQAGTSREAVLGAPLASIKRASRARTVDAAANTALELRALPEFAERDALAGRIERRGAGHAESVKAIDTAGDRVEAEHRVPLGALLNQLRVDVVRARGRLVAELPFEIVDSIFPHAERDREGADEGGEGGGGAGGAGGGAGGTPAA